MEKGGEASLTLSKGNKNPPKRTSKHINTLYLISLVCTKNRAVVYVNEIVVVLQEVIRTRDNYCLASVCKEID